MSKCHKDQHISSNAGFAILRQQGLLFLSNTFLQFTLFFFDRFLSYFVELFLYKSMEAFFVEIHELIRVVVFYFSGDLERQISQKIVLNLVSINFYSEGRFREALPVC